MASARCESLGVRLVAFAGLVLGVMHLRLALPVVIIVAFYHGFKACTLPQAAQPKHWPPKPDRAALLRRLSSDKLLAACGSTTTVTQTRPCSSAPLSSSESPKPETAAPAASEGHSPTSSPLCPPLHPTSHQPAAHSGLATLGSAGPTARQLLRMPSRIPSPPSTPIRLAGPTRIPRPPTPASTAASLQSTTASGVSELSASAAAPSPSPSCRLSCQPSRTPASAGMAAPAARVQRAKHPVDACASQRPAAPKAAWSSARPHTQRRTTTLAQACIAPIKTTVVRPTAASSHAPEACLGACAPAPATLTARGYARSQTLPAGRSGPSPILRRTASAACKPWGASQASSRLLVRHRQQQQQSKCCAGKLDLSTVMWTNPLHCAESAAPCNYED